MTTTTAITLSAIVLLLLGIFYLADRLGKVVRERDIYRDRNQQLVATIPRSAKPAYGYFGQRYGTGFWRVWGVWEKSDGKDYVLLTIRDFTDKDESYNRREAEYLLQTLREA